MRLLSRIFRQVAIIRVEYTPNGTYCANVSIVDDKSERGGDWEQARKMVCAVVVCGNGVIAKPEQSDIAIKVRGDNDVFLYNSSDGYTVFIRRDRLAGVFIEFAEHKIIPVQIVCVDASKDNQTVCIQCAEQVREALRWLDMVRLTNLGSSLAQAFVRRVALSVLGLFMLLLLANIFIASRLNTNRQQLQTELEMRERSSSVSKTTGERQRAIIAQFSARTITPYAVICDRIAAAIPESGRLTLLEIWPLAKRFEPDKPLICRERIVVVSGYASSSVDISLLTNRLSEFSFCRSVKLANLEKERDGNRLIFKIELAL